LPYEKRVSKYVHTYTRRFKRRTATQKIKEQVGKKKRGKRRKEEQKKESNPRVLGIRTISFPQKLYSQMGGERV